MNVFEWKYKYFANVFEYFLNTFEYISVKMEIYIINGGIIQNKKHLWSYQLLFVISNYNKHNIQK